MRQVESNAREDGRSGALVGSMRRKDPVAVPVRASWKTLVALLLPPGSRYVHPPARQDNRPLRPRLTRDNVPARQRRSVLRYVEPSSPAPTAQLRECYYRSAIVRADDFLAGWNVHAAYVPSIYHTAC